VTGRCGAVLVAVVLLMLAATGVAHGLLLLATYEVRGADAAGRILEVQAGARAAADARAVRAGGDWVDSVAVGAASGAETDWIGSIEVRTELRRLTLESWLAEGRAREPRGAGWESLRLVWLVDPVARMAAMDAVVLRGPGAPPSGGGVLPHGSVSEPFGVRAACAAWAEGAAGAAETERALSAPDSVPLLPAPLRPSISGLGLGLLAPPDLLAAAVPVPAGSVTPEPLERLGACLPDEPTNWGDPDRPDRPCGGHLPLVGSTGDLTVSGGVGQGVLVVDGALAMEGDVRFYGVVIATGPVRIGAGASIVGRVQTGGGVQVDPGGSVAGSVCRATRSLAALRSLPALVRVSEEPIGPL